MLVPLASNPHQNFQDLPKDSQGRIGAFPKQAEQHHLVVKGVDCTQSLHTDSQSFLNPMCNQISIGKYISCQCLIAVTEATRKGKRVRQTKRQTCKILINHPTEQNHSAWVTNLLENLINSFYSYQDIRHKQKLHKESGRE